MLPVTRITSTTVTRSMSESTLKDQHVRATRTETTTKITYEPIRTTQGISATSVSSVPGAEDLEPISSSVKTTVEIYSAKPNSANADRTRYESELEAMRDSNFFSIKGLPLLHFHALIEKWGGRVALAGLTTKDVCTQFVIPATRLTGLSLCAQYFITAAEVDTSLSLAQDAKWFVSHTWQYPFLEVVDALDAFCRQEHLDPATTMLWFDLFSNSQHNTSSKTFEWWETVFMNAIKQIGNVVMIMLPWENPIPLRRSWCLFEVYAASFSESNFHMAMTKSESDRFLTALQQEGVEEYHNVLANVNLESSEAFYAQDKEQILKLAEKNVGLVKLHQQVFHTISKWLISSLERQVKGAKDDLNVAAWKDVLGRFVSLQGNFKHAEKILWSAWDIRKSLLGEEHPDTLHSLNNLAMVLNFQGKLDKAEKLYLQAYNGRLKVLGKEHPDTLDSMNNLANIYQSQAQFDKAEPLHSQCLKIREKVLGHHHQDTLRSLNNLANLYLSQGKIDTAEPLLLDCLQTRKRILGIDHPDSLRSVNNLANLYKSQGNYERAEPLYVESLESRKKLLGNEHPDTLRSLNNLAMLYQVQGKTVAAEQLYVECLDCRRKHFGSEHPDTLRTINNLGTLYQAMEDYSKAEALFIECLETRMQVLGKSHNDTISSMTSLGHLYSLQNHDDKAVSLYVAVLELKKAKYGAAHISTIASMHTLACVYEKQGLYAKAEPLFVECLQKRQAKLGYTHSETLSTMSHLAQVYQAQGDYQKAEPLFSKLSEVTQADEAKGQPKSVLSGEQVK